MMQYLLEQSVADQFSKFQTKFLESDFEASAISHAMANSANPLLESTSSVATLNIHGILTPKPSFMAMFFGGGNTAYSDINDALVAIDNDNSISSVVLDINSPGGAVDGLFQTIDNITSFSKPISTVVSGQANSAAYALAASTDSITASNRGAMFGSVGVVVDHFVDDNIVSITSTNAPNKRPDITTDAGKAIVVAQLDAIEDLFIDAIASGRSTTSDVVKKDFGKGAVFLAGEAEKKGMIDGIAAPVANFSNSKIEAKTMTLDELKAQHAGLLQESNANAVAKERDRVAAHLTMGEASGDMATAIEAIKAGDSMSESLQAKYMAAGMTKNNMQARADDNPEAIEVEAVAATESEEWAAKALKSLGVK
jgi:ClpP class serine protease